MNADDDADAEEDLRVLDEMVRQAERVVDHQTRAIEELDDKSEQMITLGVAAVAAGLALGAYLLERLAGAGFYALVLVGMGVAASLTSVVYFMIGYGVFSSLSVTVGPRPQWLSEKASSQDWDKVTHQLSVLAGFANYAGENSRAMATAGTARQVGARFLLTAILAYALSVLGFVFMYARANG